MKYVRCTGIYLTCVCVALAIFSYWQATSGTGQADLSFVILIPLAIGLICTRSWALWGTGILGALSTAMVICFALAVSVSGPRGFSMALGPIAMDEPSALRVWAFVVVYAIALGVPMLSVLAKRKALTR